MENKWLVKVIDIDIENENVQKSIEKLLEEGFIKSFLGKDYFGSEFMYKIKDENYILETLKGSEYKTHTLIEQLSSIFHGTEMTLKNSWNDEISISPETIIDLIKDNIEFYIPENKQKEIFESESPASVLSDIFTEIGKEQLRIQLEDLIKFELKKAKFK